MISVKKQGLYGCGTQAKMSESRLRKALSQVDGILGVDSSFDKMIIIVRDNSVKKNLPSWFERHRVWVTTDRHTAPKPLLLSCSALPEGDKLTDALNSDTVQEIFDEVISSGQVDMRAYAIPPSEISDDDDQYGRSVTVLAQSLVKEHNDELGDSLKFETSVKTYSNASMIDSARTVAREVIVYTDKDDSDTNRITRKLNRVARQLPVNASTTKVVTARTSFNYDEDPEDVRHLTVTAFINRKTGRALVFYMVEGRM